MVDKYRFTGSSVDIKNGLELKTTTWWEKKDGSDKWEFNYKITPADYEQVVMERG